MESKIRNGGSEPIYCAGLQDAAGTLLTGLSNVYLRIRRDSDGYYYDFADDTFKASPGSPTVAMTEVDATNEPGLYRWNFDLSAVTNEIENDVYHFRVTCASAVNAPQEGQIVTDDLEAKSGWGDYTFTATVEDSGTDPIPAATVQIRDSAGAIVVAKNTTDINGQATFLLDAGTYKAYVYAQGYSFSNPYSLVVSGDGSATYTGTGDGSFEITPPESPGVCRLYGYTKDIVGAIVAGVKVKAELSSKSAYVKGAASGTLIVDVVHSTKTDANGFWYLDLIPNADLEVDPAAAIGAEAGATDTTYTVTIEAANKAFKHTYRNLVIPDQSTADLKDLI